jgi:hypothetical protein
VAIAALATFVASLAHTVGGGTPPGPVAIALALAFSAPLAMLLVGGRARLLRTSIAALISQAALHLGYAIVGGASVSLPASAHGGHLSGAQPGTVMTAPVIDHGHALMPIAHLAAAAIIVVALAFGDDALRALNLVVGLFVRRLTSLPSPVIVSMPRIAADASLPTFLTALRRTSLWSRGPPRVVAAA